MSLNQEDQETRSLAVQRMEKIGAEHAQTHVFLCIGPKCCSEEFGLKVWDYLKRRSGELSQEAGKTVLRTKVGCLRVCRDLGPIALAYPSGNWYQSVDHQACEQILQHEVLGNPLPSALHLGFTRFSNGEKQDQTQATSGKEPAE